MISHNPHHHPEPSVELGTILYSVLHSTWVPMDDVPGEMPVLVLGEPLPKEATAAPGPPSTSTRNDVQCSRSWAMVT